MYLISSINVVPEWKESIRTESNVFQLVNPLQFVVVSQRVGHLFENTLPGSAIDIFACIETNSLLIIIINKINRQIV